MTLRQEVNQVLGLGRRRAKRSGRVRLVASGAGDSPEARAFRDLYRNLREGIPTGVRSILFTSPGAREGKTTVVCNLALAMAAAGERLLLVDANLHRPTLQTVFPLANDLGLTTLIGAPEGLRHVVQEIAMPRFHVLTAGPLPPGAPPALDPVRVRAMVREAVDDYGVVLVDGSAVLESGDALVWARSVGGVVLVVREGGSDGEAREARESLEAVGVRLLGVVVNRSRGLRSVQGAARRFEALVGWLEAERSGKAGWNGQT